VVTFHKEKSKPILQEVKELLSKNSFNYELYDEEKDLPANDFDIVLVIGGDGSMLSAAKKFSFLNCHFLGINLGRVGFMADLDPGKLEENLLNTLKGNNEVEEKDVIECSYNGDKYHAYNEAVLHTEKSYKLIDFQIKIEDSLAYRKRSDGLIISTVTGSTAYSLSAGGPILSPEIEGFVVTPLNPLSLSARPLIVSNKKVIEVNVLKIPSGLKSLIILDGNQEIMLENTNLSFSVRSADRKFKLVHPKGYDFYQICRSKLNWSLNKGPEN
jgi:NAD+ kinase